MSVGTPGPDVVKLPRHVHNKYRTVSFSILFTPDQQNISTKYAPTGIMKIMIQKNNCDGFSVKKLIIGNSGTKNYN